MLPFLAPVVGMLADKGLNLLSDALGSAADTGVEAIKDKVKDVTGIDITNQEQVQKLSPAQVAELKKAEKAHEKFLVKYALKRDKMYIADTQSAREMQMSALRQDDRFAKRFVYWFAAILTAITLIYCGCVTFIEIPEDNVRLAYTILGVLLGTVLSQIIGFFFGSSKGSDDKNAMIREMQTAKTPNAPPPPAESSKTLRKLAQKYGL